jgi:phenylacetate-CoA ligase
MTVPNEAQPSAADYVPIPALRKLQLERLQAVVRRTCDKIPLFHVRMQTSGVVPGDVRSLEDIARLPFTVKTDLRDNYPFGLCASPMEEVVRLHASSGTTGKPIVVAYTQGDVDVWTNAMVRTLACSQGGWAFTMGPRGWAPRSFRPPAATPTAKS